MLPSICFFRNQQIFTLRCTKNKGKKYEEEDIEYSSNVPHPHRIQEVGGGEREGVIFFIR